MYNYEYPHPALTVDCVIFGFHENKLKVLLIERLNDPFKNKWALPGGYVDIDESCENAAKRELQEETGVKIHNLTQIYTFSEVNRDPRERTISVAYYAEVKAKEVAAKAGDDAKNVRWFDVNKLPKLAFDHDKIIKKAQEHLRNKSRFEPIGLTLMPDKFHFNDLHKLYEAVWGKKINRIYYKNKIDRLGHLFKVDEEGKVRNPLVRFNKDQYERLVNEGCLISFT